MPHNAALRARARSGMAVRVTTLPHTGTGDQRTGGSPADRLAAVAELTLLGWTLARRPFPAYTRGTMPVRVTTLSAGRETP